MYAFVDETGNTGENVFDPHQPDFLTIAPLTRSDFDIVFGRDFAQLLARLQLQSIHSSEIGMDALDEIAGDLQRLLRRADARFSLDRIEKKYLVTTKVADHLFDPRENLAVPWHVYSLRFLRMVLVFRLGQLLDEELARTFMAKRPSDAQGRFVQACGQLRPRASSLPDAPLRLVFPEAIDWAD